MAKTEAKGWFGLRKAPKWVGAAVILIGLIAMAGGIAGGILKMLVDLQKEANTPGFDAVSVPTQMMEALVEFMQALASAPQWLALTILGTVVAYVIYYVLIERTSATFTSTVTYIIPVNGLILGALVLGESLEAGREARLIA